MELIRRMTGLSNDSYGTTCSHSRLFKATTAERYLCHSKQMRILTWQRQALRL
jgi:hypothetical protein